MALGGAATADFAVAALDAKSPFADQRIAFELTAQIDPQETFIVSVALRQVSERSGRIGRGLTEYCSALADVQLTACIGQQYDG